MSVLHSFLWQNNVPLYEYSTCYSSVHQLMDILGYFHFSAIKNNAAVNICIHLFVWTYMFSFLLSTYLNFFSKMAISFYISTNNVSGFQILHILTHT